MTRTYHGSCHCGAVAYEAELDLAAGTSCCNCSYCRKTRAQSARSTPEHFRLSRGGEAVAEYRLRDGAAVAHYFCRRCGTPLYTGGDVPEIGGGFVSVMLATLDDASAAELIEAPLTWCDGLADNWWNPPAEMRHL